MTDPVVSYRNPAGVRRPNGLYSHAAVLHDGSPRLCYVSGQVGVDLDGVADPSFERQMEQVFTNLAAILSDVGGSLGTVLQLTTYLADRDLIDRYFAKREQLFPTLFPAGYPPNALLVVSALARPGLLIEVQAVAALPDTNA